MSDNLKALRQQLQQLQALHASGVLDEAQYVESRARLERKLAAKGAGAPAKDAAATAAPRGQATIAPRRPGAALWATLGVIALLVAAAGYWWTGSPEQIGQAPQGFDEQARGAGAPGAPDGPASAPHALDSEQFNAMAERLATRLKSQPDDVAGWSMLARSYMALGRHDDALVAFKRVLELQPDDANGLADYADALAVKNNRDLEGEPAKLIERALKIDPDNLKALTLAGTIAFNRRDYAKAAQLWDRAAQVGPPDSPIAQQARNAAAEARELGKLPPAAASEKTPAAAAAPAAAVAPAGDAGAVSGTVSLAPELKGRMSPEDAVFIFARPAAGSRMPLAILRKQVKDLPFQFRLDDSLAMSPAARVSLAGQVIVGARVSKSGQAMPQPGDLEGLTGATAVGSSGVAVVISNVVK
jgi:cytochrome c-type biogenesis protein CcmH